MTYKVGDWVKIVNSSPARSLTNNLGHIVQVHIAGASAFVFQDPEFDMEGHAVYGYDIIERMATEEEVEGVKAKLAEIAERKRKEKEEAIKNCIYKAEDVGAIAIDIFGKDRVRFQKRNSREEVMIHFPHIDITNAKDEKHVIKDLYVKYSVYPSILDSVWELGNFKADIDMLGMRNTVSLKEYESKYTHSHLQLTFDIWSHFCLGSSEFNSLFQNLKLSLSEEDWELLFLSLDNYLKWESIEGGPYSNMRNIGYSKKVGMSAITRELHRIGKDMPRDIWDFRENQLHLIEDSPLLLGYYSSVSKLRDTSCYSKEEAEAAIKKAKAQVNWKRKRNGAELMWGDEKKDIEIFYEEPEKDGERPVAPNIIRGYNKILKEKGLNFIKNYVYDRAKQQNRKRVFG